MIDRFEEFFQTQDGAITPEVDNGNAGPLSSQRCSICSIYCRFFKQ